MNEPHGTPSSSGGEHDQSALFAHLVIQQSNLALMLLGRTPHPETGRVVKDLDSARFLIDQLEMLEVKTKGNLSKDESGLLKQSLMSLHLAFVEAVESPVEPASPSPDSPPTAAPPAASEPKPTAGAEGEHRVKYSKKY
jgi:hypothetical protein